jgi:hypothetical protein
LGRAPDHGSVRAHLSSTPDEPSKIYKPYNESKKGLDPFAGHPELPRPY